MRSVEVDGLNLGEGGQMVGFSVESSPLFRGGGETPAEESASSLFPDCVLTYCTRTLSCISHL